MTTPIVQTACLHNGSVVTLHRDGSIRQMVGPVTAGEWQRVDTTGVDGRLVQLAPRYDGRLVALADTGELFEQYRDYGHERWRKIAAPAED